MINYESENSTWETDQEEHSAQPPSPVTFEDHLGTATTVEYIDVVICEAMPPINLPDPLRREIERTYYHHQNERAQRIMSDPHLALIEALRQRDHYLEMTQRLEQALEINRQRTQEQRDQILAMDTTIDRLQRDRIDLADIIQGQAQYIQALEVNRTELCESLSVWRSLATDDLTESDEEIWGYLNVDEGLGEDQEEEFTEL